MFYSRELFQAQGPLAQVWMAANKERNLSKQSILQANLASSIDAIVAPTQAPLALRVTSKLLLGAARIHNRQARYLLDDCSAALTKLKLAFRPTGSHDISVALHPADREALLMPDRITTNNIFEFTLPDFDLTQPQEVKATPVGRKGRILLEDLSSQYMREVARDEEELGLPMELDLDLDFGLDFEEPRMRADQTMEIETGREAPLHPSIEEDPFAELQLEVRKEREPREFDQGRVRIADEEGDILMGGEDMTFAIEDQSMLPPADVAAELLRRRREFESPLSDVDPDFAKEVEREYALIQQRDEYEQRHLGEEAEEEEAAMSKRALLRAKKHKGFVPDQTTVLTMAQMKEVQDNPREILREQHFLPRNPYILSLLDVHAGRSLVSNILLGGRTLDWAPELRGMLSMMAPARATKDLKRKRGAEAGEEREAGEEEEEAAKSPRLELEHEELGFGDSMVGGQTIILDDGTVVEIPADESLISHRRLGSPELEPELLPAFDETTIPIVHPADSGPVSMATKHVVHTLREIFGPEAEHDDAKRTSSVVVFQDLLPERRTTKADATRMFFECLVLATKDAIKVDQAPGLGAPIRIRAKRGLWGAWAEREAGGEAEEEEEEEEEADEEGVEEQREGDDE